MESLQQILDLIPIKHNLVSQLMFIGVIQGIFLSLVIFKKSRDNSLLIFFALSLFCQSIVFLDTYLCYTGLMKYAIYLNDSTEPIVLCIAPTFYLFLYSLIERKAIKPKNYWLHFSLPIFYSLTQIPYYLAPLSIKLNAYLGAYHNTLNRANVPTDFNYAYHMVKDRFDWMVLVSFLFYGILSLLLVRKEWKRKRIIPNQTRKKKYLFTRNAVIILFLVLCIIFMVFYRYEDDGGDHYIAMVQTIVAFSTTYIILMESRFFDKSWIADKYETLTSSGVQFDEIDAFVNQNKYFESSTVSLQDLATHLNSNTNLISKVINIHTAGNFNDYINRKRVLSAKKKLQNGEHRYLTIEAIGEKVGFRSKSAFYNAFKKHTGHSPSHYTNQEVTPEL